MSKLISPSDAAALIPDGCTLGLGGFAITRNVIALVHELIRAGRRDLTLVQVVGGMDTDLLVGAGCVRRLIYSGGSLDRFGRLNMVNRAAQEGSLETLEYSSLSLLLRLHAQGLGLPFIPGRAMLGSDLLERQLAMGGAKLDQDPFTGVPVVLLPPLALDLAVVHVDRADERGNACIAGPNWAIRETAFAARRVLVLCEEVVPSSQLPPDDVTIPGAIVSAVVAVPRAAHPTAVYQSYGFDRAHFDDYVAHTKRGSEGFAEYMKRYVLSVGTHADYLQVAGVTV